MMAALMVQSVSVLPVYAASKVSASATGLINSSDGAVLRSGSSTSCRKIAVLKDNTKVTIIREVFKKKTSIAYKNKWFYVQVGNKKGYVRSDLVDTIRYSAVAGKIKANVNYRRGPGTKMKKGGSFKKGTAVTVYLNAKPVFSTRGSSTIWYKVKVNSKYYYVASNKVDIVGSIFANNTSTVTEGKAQAAAALGSSMSAADFEAALKAQGFPEDYKVKLRELHKLHPNWVFLACNTGVSWKDALAKQTRDGVSLIHSSLPVSYRSKDKNSYKDVILDTDIPEETAEAAVAEEPAEETVRESLPEETEAPAAEPETEKAEEESVMSAAAEVELTEEVPENAAPAEEQAVEGKGISEENAEEVLTEESAEAEESADPASDTTADAAETADPAEAAASDQVTETAEVIPAEEEQETAVPEEVAETVEAQPEAETVKVRPDEVTGSKDAADGYIAKEPGWYNASSQVVAYYMDPRNFLNEDRIYMFEDLSYQPAYQKITVVTKIISPSKLPGCGFTAKLFMDAGSIYDISPVFLAARARQETGGGSVCINGTKYNGKVVYNPFNIGATGKDPATNGLKYAYNHGWTTQAKAVNGAASYLASGYINRGQNSIYLQRFNVANGLANVGTHQYMTNIQAPYSEASFTKTSYASLGITGEPLAFIIPIYKDMPKTTDLPK